MSKSKSWSGTLNNWTEAEYATLLGLQDKCTWMVIGKEKGEEGTPHLQMSFTFRATMTLSAMKKAASPRAHWEVTKHQASAMAYCRKDGDFFESKSKEQGKRADLASLYENLAAGGGMAGVMATHPCLQHLKIAEMYLKYIPKKRLISPREVLWYYGPTGSGKSRASYEKDPGLFSVNMRSGGRIWWDGYADEKTVLLDDWRPAMVGFEDLLHLTDMYPLRGDVKGSTIDLPYDRIIITCPRHPREYFQDKGEDVAQLLRRITTIKKFELIVIESEEEVEVRPAKRHEVAPLGFYDVEIIDE